MTGQTAPRVAVGESAVSKKQTGLENEAAQFTTALGPLVGLAPGAAQAVAMAIHELATNAAKYGALSRPGGHVSIGWSKDPATDGLLLVWREQPDKQEGRTDRDQSAVEEQEHERPPDATNAWRLELAGCASEAVAASHRRQRMTEGEQECQDEREGSALQRSGRERPEHRQCPHRGRRRV